MPKVSLPEAAKPKPDKEKMPKEVSLAEALAKIDASHLEAYLADSPTWYPGIGLLNLVDYFGNALSKIPFTHIPQDVYHTAAQWIDHAVQFEPVCSFVLWSFGFIHDCFVGRPGAPNKSQLAVFVVLSIILRSNPRVLLTILSILMKPRYRSEDALDHRFKLTAWLIAQISQDDLPAGLFSWPRNLLPLVVDKNKCNPESVDLVLQFIENILASPGAEVKILEHAIQDDEMRLIPMSSFEILLRLTFPDPSDRVDEILV